MADYQEYRRHVLHKRWRRMFSTVLAFLMLVLLCGVWVLWRQLYPTPPSRSEPQATLLEQALPSAEWRTLSYTRQTSLTVQKLADGVTTAMDFRLASMPATEAQPVDLSFFDTAVFLGDSITQGMQIYDTGLPNAQVRGYRSSGPQIIVNNATVHDYARNVDEAALDAVVAAQPDFLYVLFGTNALVTQGNEDSFIAYYDKMIEILQQNLPGVAIYIQAIPGVQEDVVQTRPGLDNARIQTVNNMLANIALTRGCYFVNIQEALAYPAGDQIDEYEAADGIHFNPEGYGVWADYLKTHTAWDRRNDYEGTSPYYILGS